MGVPATPDEVAHEQAVRGDRTLGQQRQPAGHGLRVLYALQGATDPPTFTLFVNRELPATYLRYLERSIREAFEFGSTPIKIRVRKRSE